MDLYRVQHDLRQGTDRIRDASLADLAGGHRPIDLVVASRRDLDRAASLSRTSPPLLALRYVPVVGTQVRAVADLSSLGDRLARRAESAATPIQGRLDAGVGDGPGRLALLATAQEQLAALRPAVAAEHVGAGGWLVPPLARARDEARRGLVEADRRLGEAQASAAALDRILRGPSSYLVLAANNAEMRAGGVPASLGVATFAAGDVRLGGFLPGEEYRLPPGTPGVAVPADINALWGRYPVDRDPRPLASSPNFPAIGPVYRELAARKGVAVDGVIELDVIALEKILGVTGPVEVDGRTIGQRDVRTLVMYENYLTFSTDAARDDRLALQSKLGEAAFAAVTTRKVPLPDLLKALLDAADGRHVLAWSVDPAAQALWAQAGVDGALDPVGLMVNVRNTGANKLDFFIRPKVDTTIEVLPGGARRITLAVTVKNNHRELTSPAVEGEAYAKDNGIPVGSHRFLVNAYLPLAAYDIVSKDKRIEVQGRDGPMQVVGFQHLLSVDEERTFRIVFTVPAEVFDIHLLPSARGFPVPFRWKGEERDDAVGSVLKVHDAP